MAAASTTVARPPTPVSASPGTQPNSTPSDTRPRDCTWELHVVGPQPRNTERRTSSGRAATANQSLGLHLTRPNTEPGCRSVVVVTKGVPRARSTDPEDGSQRRYRTAGPSANPSRSRFANTDPPIASRVVMLAIKPIRYFAQSRVVELVPAEHHVATEIGEQER